MAADGPRPFPGHVPGERPCLALGVLEKTRGRALLDQLGTPRVDLRSVLSAEEYEQYQALRHSADRLSADAIAESIRNEPGAMKRVAQLEAGMVRADDQLKNLADELGRRHPELNRISHGETLSLSELARWLPADTALLEYSVASCHTPKTDIERADLLVMTARHGKAVVTAYRIGARPKDLQRPAAVLRGMCMDPRAHPDPAARELYDLLVRPAEARLAGKKRLLVCPDGPLWDVPFAALLDRRGRPMAGRWEIACGMSASVTRAVGGARSARRGWERTALALANPELPAADPGWLSELPGARPIVSPSRPIVSPSRLLASIRGGRLTALPGAQREAAAIMRDFPDARALTGAAAQEEAVKQEARGCRYLHIATHGFFNARAPLLSCVMLAQPSPGSAEDGFLTAREVLELDLSAEMAVLSACNTARADKRAGEGVVGMTWALFAAGVSTQVLSQWAVDDEAAALLMERFYAGLKAGKAKGQALREAALALRADGKHSHPYYWAPFILMGDWR